MAMDKWRILPGGGTEDDEFSLASFDLAAGHGDSVLMSEARVREELAKHNIPKAEVDAAIVKARKSKADNDRSKFGVMKR